MKQIKVTETNTVIKYQAIDGEIFSNKEECEKYETTAKAVLQSKFKKLIVGTYNSWELHGGLDDNDVIAVQVKTQKDADIVLQRYYIENSWLLENYDSNKKCIERCERLVNKALVEKDILLIGINCEGDLYFINTRKDIIDNLNNIGHEDNSELQD